MALPNHAKKLEMAERRLRVGQLVAQAWTFTAIARELKVTRRTVYSDFQAILADRKQGVDEVRDCLVLRLENLEREGREAWERSKKPKQKTGFKEVENNGRTGKDGTPLPGNKRTENNINEEGRDGNPKFLGEARAAVMDQAKLHGLLRNDVELTGPGGGPVPITVVEVVKDAPVRDSGASPETSPASGPAAGVG